MGCNQGKCSGNEEGPPQADAHGDKDDDADVIAGDVTDAALFKCDAHVMNTMVTTLLLLI